MTDESAPRRSYPAKILLFGEHTVLRGSRGLAVPYPSLSLHWETGAPDTGLLDFAAYLGSSPLAAHFDTDRLVSDLRGGARLAGDIPTGYGLGSSGAVCAAVFDGYAYPPAKKLDTGELRQLLAGMEGHFHGQSSGTDPLIAYLRRPLLLSSGGSAGPVELPERWATGFFLVDTGRSRSASHLIEQFTAAYDGGEGENIVRGWTRPVEQAITALMNNDRAGLYGAFSAISEFQLSHFPHFIPEAYRTLWDGGNAYRLKLCGAGGGGMLLGLATDRPRAEAAFGPHLQWL